jgi:predicted metalloprotease
MRWVGRRESENVEDRRGQGGGVFGGGPGGGLGGPRIGIPMGGRGGGIGIVGLLIILGIGWFLGINPLALLSGQSNSPFTIGRDAGGQSGQVGAPGDQGGKFIATVLADTEDTWKRLFEQQGRTYQNPTLVLFKGETQSACGFASAASGPFYCPNDRKLYIDLAFYDELSSRFGAPGDFAEAYVIAHEVGHHVQNLLGILPKVDEQRQAAGGAEANRLSVRLELQADCFAGIWAREAEKEGVLEAGDMDEALTAAAAVGDDTLQKRGQGRVVPESFTHGSAAERTRWFKQGFDKDDINGCDTFGAGQI